ncbi:cbb3-type cytochrome c oxidase subunit 3 [Candidatus Parabeggiatoa sp. HSG14]|uniref:cbb3-type cytochrome oxidase subunit 3 n=1 Tax=Candidatus Parabeggiatoa sp. HSG14 TaxID=3055593 RepID=UPI0025A85A8B|nr:cbb3-type cytochrome c oxidase subunit 3 [Thiotrichales bacterium HSG14]
MDILVLFQSVWTIIVMILFIGIVIWTFSRGVKFFDEAANLPINDNDSIESTVKEKQYV